MDNEQQQAPEIEAPESEGVTLAAATASAAELDATITDPAPAEAPGCPVDPDTGDALAEVGAGDSDSGDVLRVPFTILGVGEAYLTPRELADVLHHAHHAVHDAHGPAPEAPAPWRGLTTETGLTADELADLLDPDTLAALEAPDPEAGQ